MFINSRDYIGKQIQFGMFFNPTYMFCPIAIYDVVIGVAQFTIVALFGLRIMIVQTK